MEWLQRKKFSIRDFFSGTDNSESESQNRPVSSRRRRTKSGGSRPSAWPLSGDETGSEAYATEYEVIGDAAEDNIRAIRERVRRQREQKELERVKQRELRAIQNEDNLVAEIAKELQNENKEVELKKQAREGRSQQRESSRNRSGKPSSRASKSLPPVPRKEQDCSPRLSAKDAIRRFELCTSEEASDRAEVQVRKKKKQRTVKLRAEKALSLIDEPEVEVRDLSNFGLVEDIYIYQAEVLVKMEDPAPIPKRRKSSLRKRTADKSSLDTEPQSESNSETSSLPQPKPRRKSRPRSRPRSRSLSAERVNPSEIEEAKAFEAQRRMSLPQIIRPLPSIPARASNLCFHIIFPNWYINWDHSRTCKRISISRQS